MHSHALKEPTLKPQGREGRVQAKRQCKARSHRGCFGLSFIGAPCLRSECSHRQVAPEAKGHSRTETNVTWVLGREAMCRVRVRIDRVQDSISRANDSIHHHLSGAWLWVILKRRKS
jgi:hypothetical protein